MASGSVTIALTFSNPTLGIDFGEWQLAGGAANAADALATASDAKTINTSLEDGGNASTPIPYTMGAPSEQIPASATGLNYTVGVRGANLGTSNTDLVLYDSTFTALDRTVGVLACKQLPIIMDTITLDDSGTYTPTSLLTIAQLNAGGQTGSLVIDNVLAGEGGDYELDYVAVVTVAYLYTDAVARSWRSRNFRARSLGR